MRKLIVDYQTKDEACGNPSRQKPEFFIVNMTLKSDKILLFEEIAKLDSLCENFQSLMDSILSDF